jgi:hypothetical protein
LAAVPLLPIPVINTFRMSLPGLTKSTDWPNLIASASCRVNPSICFLMDQFFSSEITEKGK